ncbi:FMN-binding negative transcriptional regulator [Stenotrophomonas sp. PS02298]|uniref:FMN-binding negative transcriptional regulator n=1 Tax=Stenotrophomonas sp. PS02298 TaxID=2991424 RepID=UPI00249B3AFB|nr:FMN-binding negative transcriptional regulator [Stenotrophomonas sp. PS02298]
MFAQRAFVETELLWLDRLLARDPFVTLLTTGDDGLPELTRVPVLYRREGHKVELIGHWAKANKQSRQLGRAKVLVNGPQGYVSASWYPDKESAARVPTWNYAAAELIGELHRFDDTVALAQLLSDTSNFFEASVGQDWQFDASLDDHAPSLRAIVGFRLDVQQIQIKLKLSQNHPQANQLAVIEALQALDTPDARELAQWMQLYRNEHGDQPDA